MVYLFHSLTLNFFVYLHDSYKQYICTFRFCLVQYDKLLSKAFNLFTFFCIIFVLIYHVLFSIFPTYPALPFLPPFLNPMVFSMSLLLRQLISCIFFYYSFDDKRSKITANLPTKSDINQYFHHFLNNVNTSEHLALFDSRLFYYCNVFQPYNTHIHTCASPTNHTYILTFYYILFLPQSPWFHLGFFFFCLLELHLSSCLSRKHQ